MMKEKYDTTRCHLRKAFTLVELVTTMAVSLVLVLVIGFVLFDSQRSWTTAYAQANGNVAVDAFVAQTVFENTVRKASKTRAWLDADRKMLELYYYAEPTSAEPDQSAHFYLANNNLFLMRGKLTPGTLSTAETLSALCICSNVTDVQFALAGTSVQMTLQLSNEYAYRVITCSAVRHRP